MTKQLLTWNSEPALKIEVLPARRTASSLHLVETSDRHRTIRVAPPSPRRESCVTKRAMLAALREAELAVWQGNGGDYLNRSPRPIR